MRDYSFGNFLREVRERRGLSQFQLGMLVGVSNKAVSKWENGSAKPQSRILYKLSDVLGITVDELLACKYRSPEKGTAKGVFAMKTELWKKTHQTFREYYGKELPVELLNRYLSEYVEMQHTDLIIWFDMLSQLAAQAKERGERLLVKGKTGASFVAFVMGATEINPLKPHYYCPHCRTIEFANHVLCGWDLPAKRCACGGELLRDGHDLPFETLRLAGRKNAHFDLAVSRGLHQTVKDMIGNYFADNPVVTLTKKDSPNFEMVVIINDGLTDIPNGQELAFEEYYDKLRHYPTITVMIDDGMDAYRQLEEETAIAFDDVPFTAPEVLEAFRKKDTDGIPEFQTAFVKNMIREVSPSSFHDLIQILGLSHDMGVWSDNAGELIKNGVPVGGVIAYCDDVFNRIQKKMDEKRYSSTGYAYKIMRDTCCGVYARGGVSDEMKQQFSAIGMDDWFADAIGKIRYLFPKAHGVVYVKYALILMWYKIHYPDIFEKYFS